MRYRKTINTRNTRYSRNNRDTRKSRDSRKSNEHQNDVSIKKYVAAHNEQPHILFRDLLLSLKHHLLLLYNVDSRSEAAVD